MFVLNDAGLFCLRTAVLFFPPSSSLLSNCNVLFTILSAFSLLICSL